MLSLPGNLFSILMTKILNWKQRRSVDRQQGDNDNKASVRDKENIINEFAN